MGLMDQSQWSVGWDQIMQALEQTGWMAADLHSLAKKVNGPQGTQHIPKCLTELH